MDSTQKLEIITQRFYWPKLAWGTARFYARNHRPIAGLRALSRVLRGDNGEQCQVCGRDYVAWFAPDWFYEQIHGSLRGTLCPEHFGAEAKAKGKPVRWTPVQYFSADQQRIDEAIAVYERALTDDEVRAEFAPPEL